MVGIERRLAKHTRGDPQREVAAVRFSLRGRDLSALDRHLVVESSSDPYFLLRAHDGDGQLHTLGRSETISQNLNAQWEPLEVSAAALGDCRQLRVEV